MQRKPSLSKWRIPVLMAGSASLVFGALVGLVGSAPSASAATPGVTSYNSLIPGTTDSYHQDQTYGGAGVLELGNQINLATPGQLNTVTVAMHNWGPALTGVPITLTVYKPSASLTAAESSGPGAVIATDTQDFNFSAVLDGGNTPSYSTITFDNFGSVNVSGSVVYGISYNPYATINDTANYASSLNVALSSSASNISVGSDAYPGAVFVNLLNSVWLGGWQTDAGSCDNAAIATSFVATPTCGSPTNTPENCPPCAYDNGQNDIPAVQFTVTQVPTKLVEAPVSIVGSLLSFKLTFSGTLSTLVPVQAVAGQTVIFAGGGATCSATTNASGVASCSVSVLSVVGLLLAPISTANFAGGNGYLPSKALGGVTLL
jgi:hypothetical protein